jgi:hypothetical protein
MTTRFSNELICQCGAIGHIFWYEGSHCDCIECVSEIWGEFTSRRVMVLINNGETFEITCRALRPAGRARRARRAHARRRARAVVPLMTPRSALNLQRRDRPIAQNPAGPDQPIPEPLAIGQTARTRGTRRRGRRDPPRRTADQSRPARWSSRAPRGSIAAPARSDSLQRCAERPGRTPGAPGRHRRLHAPHGPKPTTPSNRPPGTRNPKNRRAIPTAPSVRMPG